MATIVYRPAFTSAQDIQTQVALKLAIRAMLRRRHSLATPMVAAGRRRDLRDAIGALRTLRSTRFEYLPERS